MYSEKDAVYCAGCGARLLADAYPAGGNRAAYAEAGTYYFEAQKRRKKNKRTRGILCFLLVICLLAAAASFAAVIKIVQLSRSNFTWTSLIQREEQDTVPVQDDRPGSGLRLYTGTMGDGDTEEEEETEGQSVLPPVSTVSTAAPLAPMTAAMPTAASSPADSRQALQMDSAPTAVPASPTPTAASAPTDTRQVLQVSATGNTAVLTLSEQREDGTWEELCSMDAYIGRNGISENKTEGDMCTPAGTFHILYYISTQELNSNLDVVLTAEPDVWVCDPESAYYNTMQPAFDWADWDPNQTQDMCGKFSGSDSVACIVFDYNGDGMNGESADKNGGAGIFIDGIGENGDLSPGDGDIRITSEDMYTLLSCLDSGKNPCIVIR